MRKLKLGVLISGSGTNLQALIDACAAPDFPAKIEVVVCNKEDAYGLERARQAEIATIVIDHREFDSREAFEEAISSRLEAHDVQLVCLAGFMRLLTGDFVGRWRDRLINIHPSLLPSYKGLHTHDRAIEDGVRFAGCTVHYVRTEMDNGPIIIQAVVPIAADDTPDTLAAKVLKREHVIYPEAVRLIAENKLRVSGHKVVYRDVDLGEDGLISPVV